MADKGVTKIYLENLPRGEAAIKNKERFLDWLHNKLGNCERIDRPEKTIFILPGGEQIKFFKLKAILEVPSYLDSIYTELWLYDRSVDTNISATEKIVEKLRKTLLRDVIIFMSLSLFVVYATGNLKRIPDIVWILNGIFMLLRYALIWIVDLISNDSGER